jgi:hypothetical protein
VGAPIRDASGRLFGTLCSYDAAPHRFWRMIREMHEIAAGRVMAILARLFDVQG